MSVKKAGLILLSAFTLMTGTVSAKAVRADDTVGPPAPVYDKPYVGNMETITAKYEDTLVQLARDNNLGFVELRAANPSVDPWLPGEGTKIILPKRHIFPDAPHEGLVINLPEMRIFAFTEKSKPPHTYPIGVGRVGLRTPSGETTIVRKKTGPNWYPTDRMKEDNPDLPDFIPAGPDNPLGSHALYLGWPEYALHGTNRPFGIGRRVSSGCIRLYPEGIIDLYERVDPGTKVTIVDQPVKAAWIGDTLYMEAHPRLDQADQIEQNGGIPDYKVGQAELDVITGKAGKYVFLLDWPVIRKAIRERAGMPVAIATKPKILPAYPPETNGDKAEEQQLH